MSIVSRHLANDVCASTSLYNNISHNNNYR